MWSSARERVIEEVQRREAAHGVEARVAERQLDRVAAHVRGGWNPRRACRCTARSSIVGEASMPTASPSSPTTRAKSRVKLPGPASHVEDAVAGRQAEQQARDAVLVGHRRAHQRPWRCRPSPGTPIALVDPRHDAGVHQVLNAVPVEAGPAPAEQVEVPAPATAERSGSAAASSSAAAARSSAEDVRRLAAHPVTDGSGRSPSSAGSPRTSPVKPSSVRRAISRSPSMRAGWSAGRPLISARDAVAQLEREVRGGGAHQLAHVLDGDLVFVARRSGCSAWLMPRPAACVVMRLAFSGDGRISSRRVDLRLRRRSRSRCSSPMIQP